MEESGEPPTITPGYWTLDTEVNTCNDEREEPDGWTCDCDEEPQEDGTYEGETISPDCIWYEA